MLQVVTYNLGGAKKLRRPPLHPDVVARDACQTLCNVIDPQQPTLIGLQEAGAIEWASAHEPVNSREETCAALMRSLGDDFRSDYLPILNTQMYPHAGLWDRDAYTPQNGHSLHYAAEGNGMVGNLRSVPWPWKHHSGYNPDGTAATSLHPIITQISTATVYSTGNRDSEPRYLMVASLNHPTYGDLFFMNTHIGTITGEDRHDSHHPRSREGEQIRLQQVREILRVTRELRAAEAHYRRPHRPIILGGDFNAVPDSQPIQVLREMFTLLDVDSPADEKWTHCVHKLLIDHILVSDPAGVLPPGHAHIITDGPFHDLSDHRAVYAIFE
ncbi:MAG: endonuclease/exonuclease/phosphatase family protein [Chloroflexota bacterium]